MTTSESNLKYRVLNVLEESKKILSGHEQMRLFSLIDDSIVRLSQPMQLAVIGKISSSKSTLVNAILGASEIVRTGQMEETFNVSWLKYGDSESPIKVVFKDGHTSNVPSSEWVKWTSHQEENVLKEKVKYIEVPYNNDILKEVNIIDTPGLDALSQIDSKNTISFLKEVHPDAVIMLFTKSIAETTMSVLQDFQNVGSDSFNLSSLNAIGVLAKADTMWNPYNNGSDIIEQGKRVVKTTLYDKYPEVRKSLFSILPVSSLMGLAASTLNEEDIFHIQHLSILDNDILLEMLSSPEFFLDEEYKIGITSKERKSLYNKFGLYGIYVLTEAIKRNQDASKDFLSEVLKSKSGFDKLFLTILSHFGGRATLIKFQSILKDLLNEISRAKINSTGAEYNAIAEVENAIVMTLLSMHEYKEWEYLSKYYDGKLDIEPSIASEFIALCGEKGYSAMDRLNQETNLSAYDLENIAVKRALHWQKQYNVISDIEPELGNFYKVIISSYNKLIKEIRDAAIEYEKAKAMLDHASSFLGFNQNKISES